MADDLELQIAQIVSLQVRSFCYVVFGVIALATKALLSVVFLGIFVRCTTEKNKKKSEAQAAAEAEEESLALALSASVVLAEAERTPAAAGTREVKTR